MRMKNVKRILAIICILILVGLYVTAFVMSFLDRSASMTLFKGCIALTIFIPVVAYLYICMHRYAMTRSKRRDYYSDEHPVSSQGDTSSSDDVSEE